MSGRWDSVTQRCDHCIIASDSATHRSTERPRRGTQGRTQRQAREGGLSARSVRIKRCIRYPKTCGSVWRR